MARLFVPIRGPFAGGECSPAGVPLGWEGWSGAEIGDLPSISDLWAAVSEVEMRDWVLTVRWPLWAHDPADTGLLDPDPGARRQARDRILRTLDEAHGAGARCLVLPWPCPPGAAAAAAGAAALAPVAAAATAAGVELRLRIDPVATNGLGPDWRADLVPALLAAGEGMALAFDPQAAATLAMAAPGVDGPADLLRAWRSRVRHAYLDGDPGSAVAGELAALAAAEPRLRVVLGVPDATAPATAFRDWARRHLTRSVGA